MQAPLACPHCSHQVRLEITISSKPTTANGEQSPSLFKLGVQPAPGEADSKSESVTSFEESIQKSVPTARTRSITTMPQSSKHVISVPPASVMFNRNLFNEPSEESVSSAATLEPNSGNKLRNLMLSNTATGITEPNKNSPRSSTMKSDSTAPQSSKTSISLPPEGTTPNPSLFDHPSESSISKSSESNNKKSLSPSSEASKSVESSKEIENLPIPATEGAGKPGSSPGQDSPSLSTSKKRSSAVMGSTSELDSNALPEATKKAKDQSTP